MQRVLLRKQEVRIYGDSRVSLFELHSWLLVKIGARAPRLWAKHI